MVKIQEAQEEDFDRMLDAFPEDQRNVLMRLPISDSLRYSLACDMTRRKTEADVIREKMESFASKSKDNGDEKHEQETQGDPTASTTQENKERAQPEEKLSYAAVLAKGVCNDSNDSSA